MPPKNDALWTTVIAISLLASILRPTTFDNEFVKYIFILPFLLTPFFYVLCIKKLSISKANLLIFCLLLGDVSLKLLSSLKYNITTKHLILSLTSLLTLIWVIAFSLSSDYQKRHFFWKPTYYISILLCTFGLFEFTNHNFIATYFPFINSNPYGELWGQISSFFGNANSFGIFCSIVFPIGSYLFSTKTISKNIYIITSLLLFSGAFISGSRMSIVLFFISFLLLGYSKYIPTKFFATMPIIAYLSTGAFSLLVGFSITRPNLNLRQELWHHAQQMWSDYTLTGVGPSQFQKRVHEYTNFDVIKNGNFSVNSYTWGVITDTGLLGIIFTLIPIGLILLSIILKPMPSKKPLIIICTVSLLSQFTENYFSYIPIFSIIFFFTIIELLGDEHEISHNQN